MCPFDKTGGPTQILEAWPQAGIILGSETTNKASARGAQLATRVRLLEIWPSRWGNVNLND